MALICCFSYHFKFLRVKYTDGACTYLSVGRIVLKVGVKSFVHEHISIFILHVSRIHTGKILNSIKANAESEVLIQSCKKTSSETVVSLALSILSMSVANLVAIGNKLLYLLCSQQGCKVEQSPNYAFCLCNAPGRCLFSHMDQSLLRFQRLLNPPASFCMNIFIGK